jgi:hypothetical protein
MKGTGKRRESHEQLNSTTTIFLYPTWTMDDGRWAMDDDQRQKMELRFREHRSSPLLFQYQTHLLLFFSLDNIDQLDRNALGSSQIRHYLLHWFYFLCTPVLLPADIADTTTIVAI